MKRGNCRHGPPTYFETQWATLLARREQGGFITADEVTTALTTTHAQTWHEIVPLDSIRRTAESPLRAHHLRAPDSLRLAAALIAADHDPISGDLCASMFEPESDTLEAFLKGRRDLMISELAITEVLSAIARRQREGMITADQALDIRDALLADADSGSFHRLDMSPAVHREAERLLFHFESVPLRTLDALHVAAALLGLATHVVTYDAHMRAAVLHAGLRALDLYEAL